MNTLMLYHIPKPYTFKKLKQYVLDPYKADTNLYSLTFTHVNIPLTSVRVLWVSRGAQSYSPHMGPMHESVGSVHLPSYPPS